VRGTLEPENRRCRQLSAFEETEFEKGTTSAEGIFLSLTNGAETVTKSFDAIALTVEIRGGSEDYSLLVVDGALYGGTVPDSDVQVIESDTVPTSEALIGLTYVHSRKTDANELAFLVHKFRANSKCIGRVPRILAGSFNR
jgi:hypothetical protein